jgi:hypothetical protein
MKTPVQGQSETRFVALMSELFQMDEAQALDKAFAVKANEPLAASSAPPLSYRLDRSSRNLYLDFEHFLSPFGYPLQRTAGGCAAIQRTLR